MKVSNKELKKIIEKEDSIYGCLCLLELKKCNKCENCNCENK